MKKQNAQPFFGELSVRKLDCVWRLDHVDPVLFGYVAKSIPSLAQCFEEVTDSVPVQEIWEQGTFNNGMLIRPEQHGRAFYIPLERLVKRTESNGGVLAFKGTEVVCENFPSILDKMAASWHCTSINWGLLGLPRFQVTKFLSSLEFFPSMESKPPLAVGMREATDEADAALKFHRKHFDIFDDLARAPIPLAVLKWSEHDSERVRDFVIPRLSGRTKAMVSDQLDKPLGVYVYYYPEVPIRMSHTVERVEHLKSYDDRMAALAESMDVKTVIQRWVCAVGRLIGAGFSAWDPTSRDIGMCVMGQNLVLDGGFVDLGCVRPLSSFRNDFEARFSLMATMQIFAASMGEFFLGTEGQNATYLTQFPELQFAVWQAVRTSILNDATLGYDVHPYSLKWAKTHDAFHALDDLCRDVAVFRET